MQDRSADISLTDIVEPWIILRPVDKNSVEYIEILESARARGFLNGASVRLCPRYPDKYEIIDGLYRFNVARDLHFETMPCLIKHGISDEDVLALQIQANAVRRETTATEYGRQLMKIINSRPGMTFVELSKIVKKHPKWISEHLGLLALPKDMQVLVDRGEIPLQSAYMLAKLPIKWRRKYLDHAISLKSKEFVALAAGLIKQFAECVQQGRMDERNLPEYVPTPYLRPPLDIKREIDSPELGALIVTAEGCKTPLEGWLAGLKWTLNLDTKSVHERRLLAEGKEQARLSRYARFKSNNPNTEDICDDELDNDPA